MLLSRSNKLTIEEKRKEKVTQYKYPYATKYFFLLMLINQALPFVCDKTILLAAWTHSRYPSCET
jgi:hypothetical protein